MMNKKQFLHWFIVHTSAFIVSSCERVTNRGDADRGVRQKKQSAVSQMGPLCFC
jgi:hypothetical protein